MPRVGQILEIEQRDLGGKIDTFYCIRLVTNGLKVMIPTSNKEGLRGLANDQVVKEVFTLLADHNIHVDNSTWNRRYREYMTKIKTGSLMEIADVLRALFLLKASKNLSFGERKMLDQCKELIVKEIAISSGNREDQISSEIDSCFIARNE
ncbi:MAG: CarD family transcriptional regulator [Bacteriovoracaceae bacterium]